MSPVEPAFRRDRCLVSGKLRLTAQEAKALARRNRAKGSDGAIYRCGLAGCGWYHVASERVFKEPPKRERWVEPEEEG